VTDGFKYKLAAILCADVAGYTALMHSDEDGTFAAYKACIDVVVLPALDTHRGRLVKSTGDGFIAVFDSVIDGLSCALAIQEGVAHKEGKTPFKFRIGLNIGDVIHERIEGKDDVHGDGVNMAARLQTLATPGGVCVSSLVRDHVNGKLNVAFESLGRKRVKPNDIPIQAFAVHARAGPPKRSSATGLAAKVRTFIREARVTGLATVTLLAVGVFAWQADLLHTERLADLVTGESASRLPLPDRPSLVVLPFKTIGEGPAQEYFADGITVDVITDLSRVSGIFVIASNSSFAYKSRPQDVRKIGRNLGVRYALEGSVQRSADTLRVTAQLIDAKDGGHVWATRFDRPLGDVFKIQDEITRKIVDALSVNIKEREQTRWTVAQTSSVPAYDAYLRGWAAYRRNTVQDYTKAIELFRFSITLDPGFAQAHAAIAAAYLAMRKYGWTRVESLASEVKIVERARQHDEELLENAREHLAIALRNPTSLAYRSSAEIAIFERRYDDAIEAIRKALALDPNDADNFAMLSSVLVWTGRPEAAIEPIERAMRLDPLHPPLYLCTYGSALFSLGRYAEAKEKFEGCKAGNPESPWPYIYLIATYAYLGQEAEAAAARESAANLLHRLDRSPFTVQEVGNRIMRYRNRADLLRLLVGLHKAKVPNSLF